MVENFLIFAFSLFLVIKGATLATKYSAKLADGFNLSKYVVGFIVVAFVSILPETLISINSALEGVPAFGLGTLFGSNVADLTLIFAILIIYSSRGIKIESKILKGIRYYPFFLLPPLILGLNGYYSRTEGAFLIILGSIFYYLILRKGLAVSLYSRGGVDRYKNFLCLIFAMALLIIGSHFVVTSATSLSTTINISPIIIGMLVVGLGTTMPELMFSLKSIENTDDGLAVGDILGTVLADATIVVGILAFISPFTFPASIIYITGIFMASASVILLRFMRSGRIITKKEGYILLGFWVVYAVTEFILGR